MGNLAGIPVAQQLGLPDFLLLTLRDFPLTESALLAPEHDNNAVKTINNKPIGSRFENTKYFFIKFNFRLFHTSETQITHS